MNRNLLIGLSVMLIVIVAGVYFARGTKPVAPSASIQPVASQASKGSVKEISISGNEFAFSPNNVTVKRGDNIKITFTNNGSFSHNLAISDLGLKTNTIGSGESTTLEFIADKVETFVFTCTVDGHKDLGMQGSLIVQ